MIDRSKRAPRRSLESMDEAIGPEDLNVLFQPIVDLDTRLSFANEALVRCSAPGLESPPVLFEHAVSHNYCGRLGRLIREQAVPRSSGMPLFVNIHPVELSERWLVRPDDPIFSHDHDIYLEITESVPLTHFELCASVLAEVRERGHVHLVVDDLGAGYSNLMRIVELRPSVVKLDIELVKDLDKNSRQRALVKSIVDMCRDQGASVVAEGIETEAELDAVINCGVQFGQGFLLARPAYPIPPVTWPPPAN